MMDGPLFTPVMQYSEAGCYIGLVTDELRCQWFVVVNDKAYPCLGCKHGLDMFSDCIDRMKEERIMN